MRRGLTIFAAALMVAIMAGILAPAALAAGTKTVCTVNLDGTETCIVVVTPDPPSHGGGGGGGQGQCTWTIGNRTVPCQSDQGWWSQAMQCYVKLAEPQPPQSDPLWGGHTTGAIFLCALPTCPDLVCDQPVWLPQPPPGLGPTPEQLAQQALASLTIPVPVPGRYPAGRLQDGTPYTVVRAATWYWTDPSTYRTLTARAQAGSVWAQVTVRPSELTFTPGDGSARASCAGPGTQWWPSDGPWASSPSGCDFRYRHTTINDQGEVLTATYGITWSVTWTGWGGSSGTLTVPATTATATFAVAEVQAVVTK